MKLSEIIEKMQNLVELQGSELEVFISSDCDCCDSLLIETVKLVKEFHIEKGEKVWETKVEIS